VLDLSSDAAFALTLLYNLFLLATYSAVHGFWPVEFQNRKVWSESLMQ
jgi:hypothetical protein